MSSGPLEARFGDLVREIGGLRDASLGLRLTALDDQPASNGTALVDAVANDVIEVLGEVQAALEAAVRAEKAISRPTDLDKAAEALADCQEALNGLLFKFALELMTWRRLDELGRLGRQRGAEWRGWVQSLLEGVDRCQRPLYQAAAALGACLLELVDRCLGAGVSVRNVAIGQQIRLTRPEAREVAT